jgi:poly(A) polymerase
MALIVRAQHTVPVWPAAAQSAASSQGIASALVPLHAFGAVQPYSGLGMPGLRQQISTPGLQLVAPHLILAGVPASPLEAPELDAEELAPLDEAPEELAPLEELPDEVAPLVPLDVAPELAPPDAPDELPGASRRSLPLAPAHATPMTPTKPAIAHVPSCRTVLLRRNRFLAEFNGSAAAPTRLNSSSGGHFPTRDRVVGGRSYATQPAPVSELTPKKPALGASVGDTSGGRPDAAMDAIEQAALAAEKGTLLGAPVLVTPADVGAAVALDLAKVRGRLDRVVMGDDPELGLDVLLSNGVLGALLPEVHAMVGFGDGEWRHKDVWKHTKQVVRQAVPRIEVRWASLFHDIGKVKTRSISPDGKVHFLGHAEVGTRMFEKMERRLPLFSHEPSLKSTVSFLILHHLRANQYDPSWTDSAVRRFARELGEHLDDLLCLARADITTKRPEKKRKGLSQIEELAARISQLAAEDAKQPPLPSGVGDEVMRAFALKPSRLIGDIKKKLEEAIAKGEIEPHLPSEAYVELIRKDKPRFGIPE